MSEVVLDASALSAYLNEEPGAEAVEEALARAARIHLGGSALQAENGLDPEAFIREIKACGIQTLEVLRLLPEDGPVIARLRPLTKAAGLYLG